MVLLDQLDQLRNGSYGNDINNVTHRHCRAYMEDTSKYVFYDIE